MTDAFVAQFLAGFDDSRYPSDFLTRYELMECLSQNEMGETLLVKDRISAEEAIAKCTTRTSLLANSNESALLKRIDHEGLPRFIAEFENEEMHCVVRSYMPGQPLDQYVRTHDLPRKQAVAIAVQLCDLLTYLHGLNPPIIHRDIKPQNVIINEEGRITLIDFGISRAYKEASQEDTLSFGTKYYAAPEQYGFSQTDGRTDIFSLGVLLCWLLTGEVNVQEAKKALSNRRLADVLTRCTAFAPKDRYASAAQVKAALTGRANLRAVLTIFGAALVALAAVLALANSPIGQIITGNRVTFQEPQVEEAVRLMLGKDETGPISPQELDSITELYIFGQNPAANEEQFRRFNDVFANSGGKTPRGSIRSLEDLPRLKNLRKIYLAYQRISDLTPLAALTDLEYLDLHHNPIADVGALSGARSLKELFLFDTNVTDLTALRDCVRLATLDVGLTPVKSLAALDGLESLQVLMIRKTPLQSLAGIEEHPMLETVCLSEAPVLDLAPLLELPRLRQVEVSQNMRAAAEAVMDRAHFTIVYP